MTRSVVSPLLSFAGILASSALFAASACGPSIADPPASLAVSSPVLVGSGPSPRIVAGQRQAAHDVAAQPLAQGRLLDGSWQAGLAGQAMATASTDSLELLSLLVACALPADQVLAATGDSDAVVFFGGVGLAPAWLSAPLSPAGRAWVSACVLAELSGEDLAVAVSLRGRHPALGASCDERTAWSFEEGAFFGDLFVDPALPLPWFACRGTGQDVAALTQRVCTVEDLAHPGATLCGFGFAGSCTSACERRQGVYDDCRAPGGPPASRAITVFLAL